MKSPNHLHSFTKLSLFIIFGVGFFLFFKFQGIYAAALCSEPGCGTGWKVAVGETKTINCCGVCRKVKVTNACAKDIFVPTRTSSEWAEFRSNKPSCVELSSCTYTLTVSKTGSGSGTVTSSPSGINCGSDCSENYNEGTTVTLTANPSSGSTFVGWSGDCSGTGSCIITMNSNKSVTVTFNISCECSSGPCCDGCHYRPSTYVCNTWTETDYGCPWGTDCGDNVGVRTRTNRRYCSGTSASCNGAISYGSWSSWSVADNCSSTERCADNDPTCNYDSSCASSGAAFCLNAMDISCQTYCQWNGYSGCDYVSLYTYDSKTSNNAWRAWVYSGGCTYTYKGAVNCNTIIYDQYASCCCIGCPGIMAATVCHCK